jgi:hypothetical protein
MAALITMTVKHNEQDIAIIKETETVSLYFRNVTCNEEGIYRIEVQDGTFNGLDIMGTLSIKGKYLQSRNVLINRIPMQVNTRTYTRPTYNEV